ncbi:hypothetical protein BKA70DRAFT_1218939 [Coprinopsis sp. MPI-PUGE-AT-0042]|nr:hypothetical protein BKA70DRAFT_1218939 [Coprinopsis sp. MPI-PUGE-AT-0042]
MQSSSSHDLCQNDSVIRRGPEPFQALMSPSPSLIDHVELNCIISEGFNHFHWEVIDRAIDDLSKHRTNSNHTTVSLRYKLPATRAPPGIPGYVPPDVEFNLTREKVFPLATDNASVTVVLFTQRDIAHEGWDEL